MRTTITGPVSDCPAPPPGYTWPWWRAITCFFGAHYYVQQEDHPMHHVCARCGHDVMDWVW